MDTFVPSEWPEFSDGDIAINISRLSHYRLHSSTLRRNSPYFARMLDMFPAPQLTYYAKNQKRTPYSFRLVRNQNDHFGTFRRLRVSENGTPDKGDSSTIYGIIEGHAENDQYWDWLFGLFYHRQPRFEDDTLAATLSGCMSLIEVAERVDSIDHVRPPVEIALTRHDEALWQSIASKPAAWAELARRIHSPQMFTESVTHLIGRWQNIADADKAEMEESIRTLCEAKFREIDLAKEAIEMRILGHYPERIYKVAADKPGRFQYQNDIYMWMAICFYRQWFCQSSSDGRTRLAPDGGYAFYNALCKGGQAYLDHVTFRDFHKYFPMSSKACKVLEDNMDIYKEEIKIFVKDIVIERTHVKSDRYLELKWLTCAVINKEDLPWTAAASTDDPFLDESEAARDDERSCTPTQPDHPLHRQQNSHIYVPQISPLNADAPNSPLSEPKDAGFLEDMGD